MDHLSVALLEGIVSDLDALQFCHLPEQLQKLSRKAEIFQIVCLLSHQSLMKGRSTFFPDCRRKDELRKVSSLGIAGPPATSKVLCSIFNIQQKCWFTRHLKNHLEIGLLLICVSF